MGRALPTMTMRPAYGFFLLAFFKLYALDSLLSVEQAPKKAALEKAMQGHVLAQAQLMGTYQKQKG